MITTLLACVQNKRHYNPWYRVTFRTLLSQLLFYTERLIKQNKKGLTKSIDANSLSAKQIEIQHGAQDGVSRGLRRVDKEASLVSEPSY